MPLVDASEIIESRETAVETVNGETIKSEPATKNTDDPHRPSLEVIETFNFFGINPMNPTMEEEADIKLIFKWLNNQPDTGMGFIWPLRKLSSDMGTSQHASQLKRIAARLRLEQQINQDIQELNQI